MQSPTVEICQKDLTVLYDSTWIPGVDFEDSDYDSEDEDYTTDTNSETTDENENSDDSDDDDDNDEDEYDEMYANYEEMNNNLDNEHKEEPSNEPHVARGFPEANVGTTVQDDNPTKVEHNEEAQEEEEQEEGDEQPNEPERNEQQNDETGHTKSRSGRTSRPPERFSDYYMHLHTQAHPKERTIEYTNEEGRVIATILQYFQYKHVQPNKKLA